MTRWKTRLACGFLATACWTFLWVIAQPVNLQAAQCCQTCDNEWNACNQTCANQCFGESLCEVTCLEKCNNWHYRCATIPACNMCLSGWYNYDYCYSDHVQYSGGACSQPVQGNVLNQQCYAEVEVCIGYE